MRLVGRPIVEAFYQKHADAKGHALALLAEIEEAEWHTFHDVYQQFPSVSRIGTHYVFNLRRNRYRVDVKFAFRTQPALVVRAGTHAEYERWSFD
jgi:mRNA interferase HigB